MCSFWFHHITADSINFQRGMIRCDLLEAFVICQEAETTLQWSKHLTSLHVFHSFGLFSLQTMNRFMCIQLSSFSVTHKGLKKTLKHLHKHICAFLLWSWSNRCKLCYGATASPLIFKLFLVWVTWHQNTSISYFVLEGKYIVFNDVLWGIVLSQLGGF